MHPRGLELVSRHVHTKTCARSLSARKTDILLAIVSFLPEPHILLEIQSEKFENLPTVHSSNLNLRCHKIIQEGKAKQVLIHIIRRAPTLRCFPEKAESQNLRKRSLKISVSLTAFHRCMKSPQSTSSIDKNLYSYHIYHQTPGKQLRQNIASCTCVFFLPCIICDIVC